MAAILGPILGASFAQNFGWRWLFWVNMPLGIIALGAVIIWFPSKSSQNTRPFNWVALTLFSLFMTSLLVLLTIPTLPLPKDLIVGITILFLCSFVGLFYSLKNKVKVAFFEFELLKNPIFRFSALANFASGIVLYGSIANLPQYVEFTLLKSVNQAGFTVMFGALGWVLGAVVVGKTVHKFGFRKEAITGGLLLTMGSALLTSRPESLIICALSQGLLGFGMGVLASSTLVLSQNTASRINIGAATSGIQFSRSLGASIGVNIFALIFSAVEQRSETSLHGEGFSAGFLFLTISASIATIFCIGLPRSNTLEFDSRADQLLENS